MHFWNHFNLGFVGIGFERIGSASIGFERIGFTGVGFARLALCTLLAGSLLGCGDSDKSFDQRRLLSALASDTYLPAYTKLADETTTLATDAKGFCDDPDAEALDRVRSAWVEARRWRKRSEAFDFGPSKEGALSLAAQMDSFPLRVQRLQDILDGTDPINTDTVRRSGASARGFAAVEFLLFEAAPRDEALTLFTAPTSGPRRCELLEASTDDLAQSAVALRDAWSDDGGAHAQAFIEAGESDAYPTVSAAVSAAYNAQVFLVDTMRRIKLGEPLRRADGNPEPTLLESYWSDRAKEDLLDNLDGLQVSFQGIPWEALEAGADEGSSSDAGQGSKTSFDAYLRTRNPALADRVLEDIAAFRTALEAMPDGLRAALEAGDTSDIARALSAGLPLQSALTSEVSGTLGITVTFNDIDGD